jgi:hypothetical protein
MKQYDKIKHRIMQADEHRARCVMVTLSRNSILIYQDAIVTKEDLNEAVSQATLRHPRTWIGLLNETV